LQKAIDKFNNILKKNPTIMNIVEIRKPSVNNCEAFSILKEFATGAWMLALYNTKIYYIDSKNRMDAFRNYIIDTDFVFRILETNGHFIVFCLSSNSPLIEDIVQFCVPSHIILCETIGSFVFLNEHFLDKHCTYLHNDLLAIDALEPDDNKYLLHKHKIAHYAFVGNGSIDDNLYKMSELLIQMVRNHHFLPEHYLSI